jgi:stage II sporulation protein AA (anti-sigma F factor antagonist)
MAKMNMKISVLAREKAGVIRLAAEGEITSRDLYEQEESKNPLEKVVGPNWSKERILLNLEKVSFIDSTGIGWLIDCNRQMKSAGGKLVLYSAPPRVREVFDLLKLGAVLNLRDNELAARQLVGAA